GEVETWERCAIYYIRADQNKKRGEIDHVIARTAGAHRKYYYRRYEYGYWTPWEQIKLDIEDNPVMPVVWNDRLLLFWLRILKQASPEVRKPFRREDKLISLSTGDIKSDPPQVAVQAVLCWSEYYNGKWQEVKTSDVDHPADIGSKAFSRSREYLWAAKEGDYLRVGLASADSSSFLLYNTHSVPKVDLPGHSDPVPPHPSRYLVGL